VIDFGIIEHTLQYTEELQKSHSPEWCKYDLADGSTIRAETKYFLGHD